MPDTITLIKKKFKSWEAGWETRIVEYQTTMESYSDKFLFNIPNDV
jgi:hypothetical protein